MNCLVHVHIVDLTVPPSTVERAGALLDSGERERAAGFRFDADRRRFVVAHAALRRVLGNALERDAASLRFTANDAGRPELAGVEIGFNLAHAGDLAAIAVSPVRAVGIDIEATRLPPHALDVARMFFAAAEVALLEQVEGAELRSAFFRCWTRKEAVLKATGRGIDDASLRDLVVSQDDVPRVVSWRGRGGEADAWRLASLTLPDGYEGAVALRGAEVELRETRLGAAALAAALEE